MKTREIKVPLRDGVMGAHVAYPDHTPAGAIVAITIHKYPGADHAFARHGGKTWSKPEADRALALTVDFFRKHLANNQ